MPAAPPSNSPAALILEDVAIGELHDVNLQIAPGEVVCLSGPSGSGKSRLLRAVADLEPHAGRVRLGALEQKAIAAHDWRRRVTLVPAETQWWADTVGEHFEAPSDWFTAFGLGPDTPTWSVMRLSSGEKQRLALLRALAHEPHALLLDEPTANLDDETTGRVERWLLERIREHRLPTLWVAHDQRQVARVGDRHFRIQNGRLEQHTWK